MHACEFSRLADADRRRRRPRPVPGSCLFGTSPPTAPQLSVSPETAPLLRHQTDLINALSWGTYRLRWVCGLPPSPVKIRPLSSPPAHSCTLQTSPSSSARRVVEETVALFKGIYFFGHSTLFGVHRTGALLRCLGSLKCLLQRIPEDSSEGDVRGHFVVFYPLGATEKCLL